LHILGLTGDMGAGKTYVANLFRRRGWPVFDADATVHRLQGPGGEAVAPIKALWPEAVPGDAIDRTALRHIVIGHPDRLKALEAIVHPLVRQERQRFLRRMQARGKRWCVLDIPLLFETDAYRACDRILVVTAAESTRLRRIMRRRGMSEEQARNLLARQIGDAKRRRLADVIIRTDLSRAATFRQLRRLQHDLEAMR